MRMLSNYLPKYSPFQIFRLYCAEPIQMNNSFPKPYASVSNSHPSRKRVKFLEELIETVKVVHLPHTQPARIRRRPRPPVKSPGPQLLPPNLFSFRPTQQRKWEVGRGLLFIIQVPAPTPKFNAQKPYWVLPFSTQVPSWTKLANSVTLPVFVTLTS